LCDVLRHSVTRKTNYSKSHLQTRPKELTVLHGLYQ
jgi:hypothetical protein